MHGADLQADKDVVGQGHRVPGPTAGKEKSCSVTMIILHLEVVIRNYLENNFVEFYHEMPIICPVVCRLCIFCGVLHENYGQER